MTFVRNPIAVCRLLGTASMLAITLTISSTAHAQEQEKAFDIPAQPLSEALAEFSRQSKINVIAPSSLTRDKTSNAIVGDMEPEQALQALIGGTALDVRIEDDGSLILAQKTADARKGGPFRVAEVDTQSDPVELNDDDNQADLQMDTIIVTGTNIRGVENPTVPLTSFDRLDIEQTGSATVEEFFRTVPQNFGSETQFVENSGSPTRSALNSSGGTSLDLRGAGAGSTLVLLNGRRLPAAEFGAFVDVSVLPLSVIERIDIQTDGASAVYGSDAVAGVVNFVTRKDYEGVEAFARYGTVTEGSLREYQTGLTAGKNWGSGGGLVSFEYTDKSPLYTSERDYIDTGAANQFGSLSSDEEKYSAVLSLNQDITNRLKFSTDVLFSNRDTVSDQNIGSQLTVRTSQENWFASGKLDYELSDQWNAGLYVDYGDTYTTSRYSDDNFLEEGQRSNHLLVIEGRTSGALLELPGGDVGVALGGLYRKEEYESGVDGTVSLDAQREVTSAYGELLVPIIGENNALPGVQALDISLAGRYENYSDIGDSFTPKIGLHWRLNDSFALRSTYSESYRAPLLSNLNGTTQVNAVALPISFLTVAPAPAQDSRLPSGFFSYVITAGANPDLEPESAKVWTGGFEFQPTALKGLSIQSTYFNVDYTDRVESVSALEALGNPAYLSFLEFDPSSTAISELVAGADLITSILPFDLADGGIQLLGNTGLQNVSSREISGFDVTVSYDWETGFGDFTASVDGTYLLDYKAKVTDLSEQQEQVDTVYRPVDLKLRGSLSWMRNGFSGVAAVNYIDGYKDNLSAVDDVPIDEWTTVDIMLSYDTGNRSESRLLRNTKFSFGVQNLFDSDPPFVDTADGLNYDPTNATPLGRLVSLRLNKSF